MTLRTMTNRAADPDTLVQAGVSLFQRGQFEAAASHGRKALKSRPAHLGALNLLGVSLNAQGEYAKASQVFAELARRDSKNADHWMNLGTSLRAQHRYEESLAAYAQAGELGEASADFFYNVGLVHFDMGNFEAARTVLRDAARLAPDDGEICYQYAVCCYETMRLKDAIAVLDTWPRMRGLTTDLLTKIGLLLMNLGELQSAGRAVELSSRDPRPDDAAVLRMIQVQERTNRVEEARAGLARLKSDSRSASLGTDVKIVEARLAEREGRSQEAHDLYVELLDATRDFHLRHHYLFPLAKTLDVLGRHDQAFAALEEAHRSQMSYLKMTTPHAAARSGPSFRIADLGCDAADVARWDLTGAPAAEDSPIFILGFPRSGTTLLEQTLDAHGSLASMDETTFLHDVIDRMVSDGTVYPARLAEVTPFEGGRNAEFLLGTGAPQDTAAAGSAPDRQEPAESARLAGDPATIPEFADSACHTPSLRCDPELLHAAFPRTGLHAAVPRLADAGGRISPGIRLLVSRSRHIAAGRSRSALRDPGN